MVTTILGQLVSVSFGRTLTEELMQSAGMRSRHPKTGEPIHLFPTAKSLLTADLSRVRTSEGRGLPFVRWRSWFVMERFAGSIHSLPGNFASPCFLFPA